jgi:hypothetical protein
MGQSLRDSENAREWQDRKRGAEPTLTSKTYLPVQPGLVGPWIRYQGQKALDDNTSPGISDCACLVEHEEVFG